MFGFRLHRDCTDRVSVSACSLVIKQPGPTLVSHPLQPCRCLSANHICPTPIRTPVITQTHTHPPHIDTCTHIHAHQQNEQEGKTRNDLSRCPPASLKNRRRCNIYGEQVHPHPDPLDITTGLGYMAMPQTYSQIVTRPFA